MKKKSPPLWPNDYRPPTWLPDWREEDDYSRIAGFKEFRFDVESQTAKQTTINTSKPEYAWEFLRRNPWYQADYQKLVELCEQEQVTDQYRKALGFNIFLGKDDPPPSMLFHAELYRALRRWGMGYYLLNPSFDIHDSGPYEGVRRLGNDIYSAVHGAISHGR